MWHLNVDLQLGRGLWRGWTRKCDWEEGKARWIGVSRPISWRLTFAIDNFPFESHTRMYSTCFCSTKHMIDNRSLNRQKPGRFCCAAKIGPKNFLREFYTNLYLKSFGDDPVEFLRKRATAQKSKIRCQFFARFVPAQAKLLSNVFLLTWIILWIWF